MQPTYWNQYAFDKYLPTTVDALAQTDGIQDWKIPYIDNKPGLTQLCTAPTTPDKKNFACTKIKCIHDRVLTSTDFYDFSFPNAIDKTKATYPDKMVIPQNFASLKFNMATRLSGGKKEVAMKNLTAINVAIYTGAISNLSLAVFGCSTVIALSLF